MFLLSVVLWILVGVGAFIFLQYFSGAYIKKYVENDLAQKLGLTLKVSEASLRIFPPMTLLLNNFELLVPGGQRSGNAEQVEVRLDLLASLSQFPKYDIRTQIVIAKPVINIVLAEAAQTTSGKSAGPTEPQMKTSILLPENFDLATTIDLQDASVNVSQKSATANSNVLSLKRLFTTLTVPSLHSPWNLVVLTELHTTNPIPLMIPVDLRSDFQIDFQKMTIDTKPSTLRIAGIGAQFSGKLDIDTLEQEWEAKLSVPDLTSVKNLSLPGNWKGSAQAGLRAKYSQELSVSGSVDLKEVIGDFTVQKDLMAFQGQLKTTAQASFTYFRTFELKTLTGNLDLTDASMSYDKLFKKADEVPLRAEFDLGQNQGAIDIKRLNVELAQLKASLRGKMAVVPGESSEIDIQVPRTALAGLEKNFPILLAPLTGFLQISASVKGNLKNTQSLLINANPVVLERVSVTTKWASADKTKTIDGLASINAKGALVIQGEDLKSSQLQAQADLSKVGIEIQDLFSKPIGQLLSLDVMTLQKEKSIHFSKARLSSAAGLIDLKGRVSEPLNPLIDLEIKTSSLNLSKLAQILPMLKKWKLSGVTQSQMKLNGQYLFKDGIEKSPLALDGEFSANLPEFSYQSPKPQPAAAASTPNPSQEKVEPVLPGWPIFKSAKIKSKLSIGQLTYNDLSLKGVNWSGNLNRGLLVGKMDIAKVLDATVSIGRIQTHLTDLAPTTSVSVVWGGLNLAQALDWSFPNWKGLASGIANGNMDIVALHPSKRNFLDETTVRGRIKVSNGFVNSLKFDQMVNEKLSKIPGVGNSGKVNSKGVAGNIDTDFDYAKSMLMFKTFNMLTPEKNEMNLKGWVRVNKTMDLKGEVYLVDPPVQGSIREANSDAKGRLVVPVHFAGQVANPELNIAEQTIKTLLSRTAEYETKKATNQLKERAQSEAKKQIDQNKGKLQDELSKGLKDLLGR